MLYVCYRYFYVCVLYTSLRWSSVYNLIACNKTYQQYHLVHQSLTLSLSLIPWFDTCSLSRVFKIEGLKKREKKDWNLIHYIRHWKKGKKFTNNLKGYKERQGNVRGYYYIMIRSRYTVLYEIYHEIWNVVHICFHWTRNEVVTMNIVVKVRIKEPETIRKREKPVKRRLEPGMMEPEFWFIRISILKKISPLKKFSRYGLPSPSIFRQCN